MPYKLSEDGLCVHKMNEDETLGEKVKCHETHDEAMAHMQALTENVEDASSKEFITTKDANGKYRWILFSSSSYQDRDGEIVSQKALESDSERMNTTKEYGTLDWWHTPLVLGDCDFSEMHGRISIESGTFRDDWIGERFATMKDLGASRMFYNPTNEPDADGVYHNIRTFSRAILPADRASNRLTMVDISAKENTKMSMQDKVQDLIKKLGGTPEAEDKVKELLTAAEQTDTAAKEAGLTAKETAPEAPEAPAPEKAWFVSDMTPDEFDARLQSAVEKFLTPAVKEIGAQVQKMNEAQAITVKEQGDKLAGALKSNQDAQVEISARLAALEGLTPRGYRSRLTRKRKSIRRLPKKRRQKATSKPLTRWRPGLPRSKQKGANQLGDHNG